MQEFSSIKDQVQGRLEQRLEQLRLEYAKGEAVISGREEMHTTLAELDAQALELKYRMLRINGAIQAIEEVLELREVESV